jgi:hypothetical protein
MNESEPAPLVTRDEILAWYAEGDPGPEKAQERLAAILALADAVVGLKAQIEHLKIEQLKQKG